MGKLSMDLFLDNVRKKYKNARRKEKSEIIAEVCAISGFHEKHAIRLLKLVSQNLSGANIFGVIKTNLASNRSMMW